MLSALSLANVLLQQKFMTFHSNSGVGSYGHHLTVLGSTGEEGPAWAEPEGLALAAPSCSPVSGEGTGTPAGKCGQKRDGLFQNICTVVESVLAVQRCQAEACPSCLHKPEGTGLLQRGQLETYQQDKVLGPRDESMADCAGDD